MDYNDIIVPPLNCLNEALNQSICAIHEMVSAIDIHKNKNRENSGLTDTIKNGVVPLLQAVTEMERLLLRKFIFLLEHFQMGECMIDIEETSNRKIKIMELYRMLHCFCPNDNVMNETIETMLQIEEQRKRVIQSFIQCRQDNDPKTVWKPDRKTE